MAVISLCLIFTYPRKACLADTFLKYSFRFLDEYNLEEAPTSKLSANQSGPRDEGFDDMIELQIALPSDQDGQRDTFIYAFASCLHRVVSFGQSLTRCNL